MNKKYIILLILFLSLLFFFMIQGFVIYNKNPKLSIQNTSKENSILYFAYGSNMNLTQMKNRCQDNFKKISNTILKDYILGFDQSGYANIKEKNGEDVMGVLYNLNQQCLTNLDGYEGYPNHYNRKWVKVIDLENQKEYQTQAYIQPENNFNGAPNQSYLQIIIKGAIENNLPTTYVDYLKSWQ